MATTNVSIRMDADPKAKKYRDLDALFADLEK